MRIIGYKCDADYRCESCTLQRYGELEQAEDSEGNAVWPVFSTDEIDESACCCECSAEITR